MNLKESQLLVDQYINQFEEGYFPPINNFVRLVEEVGELSRHLNHRFGPKKKKSTELKKDGTNEEVGDILFTLIVLANQLDINLEDQLKETIEKYNKRDLSRWTKKKNDALPLFKQNTEKKENN